MRMDEHSTSEAMFCETAGLGVRRRVWAPRVPRRGSSLSSSFVLI